MYDGLECKMIVSLIVAHGIASNQWLETKDTCRFSEVLGFGSSELLQVCNAR